MNKLYILHCNKSVFHSVDISKNQGYEKSNITCHH